MAGGSGSGANGYFDGQQAYVESGDSKTDIYYGGSGGPLGPGHGHVVTNPDGGVEYWREPGSSQPSMDSNTGRQ